MAVAKKATKKVTKKKPVAKKTPTLDFYHKYIIKNIDSSGYGVKPKGAVAKLVFLKKTFLSEYGFNVKRMGTQKAMAEWLAGLPSVLDLPFYNDDIIKFAQKGGTLSKNPTNAQINAVLKNYWNYMANKALQAMRKYKVV